VQAAKITGMTCRQTISSTSKDTWSSVIENVKCLAHECCHLYLCSLQGVRFVDTYLLSKIWYCTQILPVTEDYTRQINTVIAWFIWAGETFRVPMSTLYFPPADGGANLIDVRAKCRALFLCRCIIRLQKPDTLTAEWLQMWNANW
jgi:hypothetical protein